MGEQIIGKVESIESQYRVDYVESGLPPDPSDP